VVERFLEHCYRCSYPAKTVIINADDGHEIVLAYLNAGDFFGEIGMFDERHERSAWVRARTQCEVAQISHDRLRTLTRELSEVLFALFGQLAIRLRDTSRKVGDLTFTDVAGWVSRALLDLREQPDAMTHPDDMQIRITRQELDRIAGCSREMVGRVLKTLEEQAFISVAGKTIVVFGTR